MKATQKKRLEKLIFKMATLLKQFEVVVEKVDLDQPAIAKKGKKTKKAKKK